MIEGKMDKQLEKFKKALKGAQRIVISTHFPPDADGIGSEMALYWALKECKKNVICVNENTLSPSLSRRWPTLNFKPFIISYDEYMRRYQQQDYKREQRELREQSNLRKERPRKDREDGEKTIDLFIVVDAHNPERLGPNMQKLLKKSKNFIYIDHHPCSPVINVIHCIDTSAAATGELVGRLITGLKVKFTREMAQALYTAIVVDTSSFRYPNVSDKTHRLMAKLIETGIVPAQIYNQIYGSKKIEHLQLLGEVLAKVQITADQSVAWIVVPERLLKKYNVQAEDASSFVNHLLILDKVKIVCMFLEIGNINRFEQNKNSRYNIRKKCRKIKISMRSNGDVDVGELAKGLGGGGHNHSAATVVEGRPEVVVRSTINKIKLLLLHCNYSDGERSSFKKT